MSLVIRKIAPTDLGYCVAIDAACVGTEAAWTFQDLADYLAWPEHGGQVALWDGRPVGFLLYRADRATRRLHLTRMGVSPIWHRRRVGTRLVRRLREWLAAVPDVTLVALVHERQLGLQCFLRAVGFRAVRICRGCHDNGASDAYLFESPVRAAEAPRAPRARGETRESS
jgi:GNAT superfamily N-acetyltransferase